MMAWEIRLTKILVIAGAVAGLAILIAAAKRHSNDRSMYTQPIDGQYAYRGPTPTAAADLDAANASKQLQVGDPVGSEVFGKPDLPEPPTVSATPSSPVTENRTASGETFRVKLNTEFKLGDYSYKVTDLHVQKAVGPEFARSKASDGAVYLSVGFMIRNDGKQTAETQADDFRLLDSQGREFSPDSRATTAVSSDFILRELHPGIFKKAVMVFEVPDDSLKANFKILIPEKGIFNSERRTAVLSLNPADH